MNKILIVVLAVAAVAHADVSHLVRHQGGPDADAQILRQDSDVGPENFHYSFETSNGIQAQEEGTLKQVGNEESAIVVQGSNQHTAPDGTVIQLQYIADENGYQPQGAHLPTPPPPQPIPEAILRSLEYIRTHPAAPEPANKRY